jgi:signal transduction histidine kinase
MVGESSVQTRSRSGESGLGTGEAGPSLQRFAAEAAVLRESMTGPNLSSRLLVDSSGRVIGVLTSRFAHSDELSEGERRAFDFSAEALEIVISSAEREEQARKSADDVIERNAELESSNARLVRTNQELERFATAASHDLQEPLRTISMYAELLSVKRTLLLDEDAIGLVNSISQSARSLSALLRDLMTYAEVGVTGDDSALTAVDLNRVVQKAIRNVGTSAAECGASITADPLPTVLALEIHVLQLFQNLISNAIKYRGELPPKIHITSCSTSDQVEFIVSDNGIGIDPQYQDRIFEAFRRLRANGSSGSGMGLTICQRIVSRYAGRIWVESQKGTGAAFHFTLPKAAVVPAAVNGSWQQPSGRTPAILLVDDSSSDASLFRLALSEAALDCHLTVITDGAAALTYLRRVAAGVNGGLPDLMVLDLHLPKCDGIEILKEMAGSAVLTAIPVVVWSSLLLQQDREALKRFPFVTSLGKPNMLEEFLNIGLRVQNLLGEPRTSPRI